MTKEVLARISQQLTTVVGPIIADLVLRIIVKEAKIDLSEEQLNQIQLNRLKAVSAKADDAKRAKPKA